MVRSCSEPAWLSTVCTLLTENQVCWNEPTTYPYIPTGGSTADDDASVATCWRPVEPNKDRSFSLQLGVPADQGLIKRLSVWGTLELRVERRIYLARWPSRVRGRGRVANRLEGRTGPGSHFQARLSL